MLIFLKKIYVRTKFIIPYYDNQVALYHLLISSGDTELNPEPATSCQECDKTVRLNQIRHRWKCISNVRHRGLQHLWVRHNCVIKELLLFNVKLQELNTTSIKDIIDNYISPHVTKLQELNTHISIRHLNTQLMTSTLDEFQFIVNETKFDIITLLEISLKNDNLTCLVKNSPIETEMRKDVAV